MDRPPNKRHQRILDAFDVLCDAVAAALGAAQGMRDKAVRAHAEAMVEMWLREDGLDAARANPKLREMLANPQLAGPVGRMEADKDASFAPWLRTGPARLDKLLASAAPGAAGETVTERWVGTVSEADGSGRMPSLWTIGRGRIGDRPTEGFPVGVPLLDDAHLQISSAPDGRLDAESLVETLLLRVVSSFRPGLVQLHVWDVGQFTGTLPGLYPLTRTGLLTVHDPKQLPRLLEEMSSRIRRVHTRILVDGHPSLRALADASGGKRAEPWMVAVLIGNRQALKEDDQQQLQRVARGGLACGVQLVLLDVPLTMSAALETVHVLGNREATSSMTGPHVQVELDEPPKTAQITNAAHAISTWHDDWRSRVATFGDLLPPDEEWGTHKSISGLSAPVGFTDGLQVPIVLADLSPHAIIGGPSGSGKTNLLLTMISSIAARYGPKEVEFYLLDFKEGVSFAQFAPGRRNQNWLPHARLIGVNINTDREFGLALLQFLADEMRRRAEAAKNHEVTKLEELRAADPEGDWPRIVAVIDEFQYLFAERDSVTRSAMILLEDVARRGRSQGIHLVLASQDISGIEAFWGRPAVFEQFVLRIALPRARRVLAQNNDAPLDLPRWHAVINHESGIKHGNEIVRLPDATGRGSVENVQTKLYDKYRTEVPDPLLFDGSRSPRFVDLVKDVQLTTGGIPHALLGQCIDVKGRAALVPLPAAPGRNIGVFASIGKDAVRVLGAAAGSLAGQFSPGGLDVVIAPLVAEAAVPADRLIERFDAEGHGAHTEKVLLGDISTRIKELAAEVTERLEGKEYGRPTVVVLYAADAADTNLGRDGIESLRKLLRFGPETGVHVLGWWRSVQRLKSLLMMSASIDDLGAWVALDVQGSELGALVPGMLFSWSPRPGRGLFFDRSQHAMPEVVIVPSLEES